MTIRSKLLSLILVVGLLGGIGLTMAFNLWRTESSKVAAVFQSGDFAGEKNPADIRGSYSFDDIEKNFAITVSILSRAFGVADRINPGAFQTKELEELYGPLADGGEVGTDAVRLFVARYVGVPYIPLESTRLPSPAISELTEKLAPADLDALKRISAPQTEADHSPTEQLLVKGKTTFSELLDWGLTQKEIEDILGIPMGPQSIAVRDFLAQQDIEFSDYKARLQALVDSK